MIYVIRDTNLKENDTYCFLAQYDKKLNECSNDEHRRVIPFGNLAHARTFMHAKNAADVVRELEREDHYWGGLCVMELPDAETYVRKIKEGANILDLSPKDIPEEYDDIAEKKDYAAEAAVYQSFIDSLSEVKEDVVNHPAHYENDKYQCIDVMEDIYGTEAVMNFCMCNAFKYIWRFQKKNGIEDIQKAQWYMNKYQELAENLTKEAEDND